MEVQVAIVKTSKFGSPESGDTLEFVERPSGGFSVVMADALTSGKAAKTISSMVVRKVIGLLAEGVRDGAAARAASDQLYTERNGQAGAYLNILSLDLETDTIVLSSNNPTPIYVARGEHIETISGERTGIGTSRNIRPQISELSLDPGMTLAMYTDGIEHSGLQFGLSIDICTLLEAMLEEQDPTPQEIADTILSEAIRLDHGMPNDDMSLVVLRVSGHDVSNIRKMSLRLPIPKNDPL